jgi:hypothetical protein
MGAAPSTGKGWDSARAHNVHVSRTRFSAHGPATRRGTVISFRLRRPGNVLLVVRSAAGTCEVLGRRRVAGEQGMNRVRFAGRLHGRPLAPGRYVIDVVVVRGSSHKRVGRIAVEIVRPGRRLTKAQRVAPVGVVCAASSLPPSLPVAVTLAIARGDGGGKGEGADDSKAGGGSTGGALGAIFKPPSIPRLGGGDGGGGGLAWVGLGVYVVLIGAFLTMLLYASRFLRGSWNP